MRTEQRRYGKTHVTSTYPWGLHPRNGHRLLCADGIIRAAELAQTAGTFFSTPAKIRIKGKVISGYMCGEEQKWIRGEKESEPFHYVYAFRQHTRQKNPHNLPCWSDLTEQQHNKIIEDAQ